MACKERITEAEIQKLFDWIYHAHTVEGEEINKIYEKWILSRR